MINLFFRDQNDKIHYFGSAFLTLSLIVIYMMTIVGNNPLIAYFYAVPTTNALGLIFEALENWILPHHTNNKFWENKPTWLRKHFSGDDWDWQDIKLNFLGSTIIHSLYFII